MPFKSAKQRALLYAKHPTIANKWAKEHGTAIKRSTGNRLKTKVKRKIRRKI
jgi:hypothetical protein|tara:strand:+ start:516 stop:671 length:156 start_codon:yes stop_codon:yes gene_type:complete